MLCELRDKVLVLTDGLLRLEKEHKRSFSVEVLRFLLPLLAVLLFIYHAVQHHCLFLHGRPTSYNIEETIT